MKYVALYLLPLVLLTGITAYAQEHPKAEFYAGYSFVRTDEESVDLTGFGLAGTATRKAANLNGWNLTINGNPTKWLGIVADFGGAYGSIDFSLSGVGSLSARSNFHSFLFGPQFSKRTDRVTFFARPLVGAVKLDQRATLFGQSASADETAFAYGAGGGVDVKVNDRISIRIFQADYILTRFDGQGIANNTQRAFRISTGFVFRNRD